MEITTRSLPAMIADGQSALVDALVRVDALMGALTAMKVELVEQLRDAALALESPDSASNSLAYRSVRAEVACALRIPERSVENLFAFSYAVVRDLPATHQAMREGLSPRHAQVIVDESTPLTGQALATYDRLVVPIALTSTPAQLARRARALREQLDPETIAERAVKAHNDRHLAWRPDRDGMGWLSLYIPVVEGMAVMTRVGDAARGLRDSGDDRTSMQKRVDVALDALLAGSFEALGDCLVRPDVSVTVPVFSLMGLTEEPATLEGYGPIPAEIARRIAARAPSFTRILIHPHTGAVLSVDRDRYRAPADLRRAAKFRDRECGFFGCQRLAAECDLDHTKAWAADNGKTEADNLGSLCPGHHIIKGNTAWAVSQVGDGLGSLDWISPAGRRYRNTPESRAKPPELPDLPPF